MSAKIGTHTRHVRVRPVGHQRNLLEGSRSPRRCGPFPSSRTRIVFPFALPSLRITTRIYTPMHPMAMCRFLHATDISSLQPRLPVAAPVRTVPPAPRLRRDEDPSAAPPQFQTSTLQGLRHKKFYALYLNLAQIAVFRMRLPKPDDVQRAVTGSAEGATRTKRRKE